MREHRHDLAFPDEARLLAAMVELDRAALGVDEAAGRAQRVGEDEVWIADRRGENVPEAAGWRRLGEVDDELGDGRSRPATPDPAPRDCRRQARGERRLPEPEASLSVLVRQYAAIERGREPGSDEPQVDGSRGEDGRAHADARTSLTTASAARRAPTRAPGRGRPRLRSAHSSLRSETARRLLGHRVHPCACGSKTSAGRTPRTSTPPTYATPTARAVCEPRRPPGYASTACATSGGQAAYRHRPIVNASAEPIPGCSTRAGTTRSPRRRAAARSGSPAAATRTRDRSR